ncbi:MAG: DUF935 domain-containing protein [Bacteroidales bacterium]|nr:DUF935 domain-containing protein [Bacteroidales bacterium]
MLSNTIIQRYTYRTRKDIADWQRAQSLAMQPDNPRYYLLQELFTDICNDALLSSQISNREEPVMARPFILTDKSGKPDEKATLELSELPFIQDLIKAILDSEFFGVTLTEFTPEGFTILPREHIDPKNGRFYPDCYGGSYINYRQLKEYGKTILEFNSGHIGVLNKTVPHVLFKKFAQSCWSELCEIYGIPPRFLKTDTQDPEMLRRAEEMLREMGSAAAMVIDNTEELSFASGVNTSGDVYNNLITLCNREISMVISGAVIGQDTVNGNYSKEESNKDILQRLIESDSRMVELYFNSTVLPSLRRLKLISDRELKFSFCAVEDLSDLWAKTVAIMPYYDIDPKWIKEKFGVEVLGKRIDNSQFAADNANNCQLSTVNSQLSDPFFA